MCHLPFLEGNSKGENPPAHSNPNNAPLALFYTVFETF